MKNDDLTVLLSDIEQLARDAGAEIMKYYKQDETKVFQKPDGSIVTEADHAAEKIVLDRLALLTPGIPVVSEEASERGCRPDISKGTFWVVDPLDGTAEFDRETGRFCVAISLIRDGRPVLGVIYAPVSNTLYSSAGPGTAARVDADGTRTALKIVPDNGGRNRVLVNDDSANMAETESYLRAQFNNAGFRRDTRGTNLRAMDIAEGSADLTVVFPKRRNGRTKWWDVAPAHAIVEAAGGKIEGIDGKPLSYDADDYQVPQHVIRGAEKTGQPAHPRKPG